MESVMESGGKKHSYSANNTPTQPTEFFSLCWSPKGFFPTASVTTKFFGDQDIWTIRAETLFTNFIAEHDLQVALADHAGALFKKMFPDMAVWLCPNQDSGYNEHTVLE